jgi:hypothetical protein
MSKTLQKNQKDQKQNKQDKEECSLCQIGKETIHQLENAKVQKRGVKRPGKLGKFSAIISSIGGLLAGGLGAIGAFGLCCVPWVAGILGIFGLSSMFLVAYNKAFIGISILLIGLSVGLFFRGRKRYQKRSKIKNIQKYV